MAFSVPTGSRRQAGQEEGLNLTRLKCGEPASVITAGRPIVCGDPFGSPIPQRPQPLDIPLRVGEIICIHSARWLDTLKTCALSAGWILLANSIPKPRHAPRSYYRSVATAWIKKPTEAIENTAKNAKLYHRRLVTPGCRADSCGRASHIRTSQRVPTAKRSTRLSASVRDVKRSPKVRRRPVYSVP